MLRLFWFVCVHPLNKKPRYDCCLVTWIKLMDNDPYEIFRCDFAYEEHGIGTFLQMKLSFHIWNRRVFAPAIPNLYVKWLGSKCHMRNVGIMTCVLHMKWKIHKRKLISHMKFSFHKFGIEISSHMKYCFHMWNDNSKFYNRELKFY